MSLAVFRGKQCEKATKCKACPEYSEGKNDNKINAMLPCLPKRHAGRDTAQATTPRNVSKNDEGKNDNKINAMLRYFASCHVQNAH